MSDFDEILRRLQELYPNLNISLLVKDDTTKILVNGGRIASFNHDLLQRQFRKMGQPSIEEAIRNFAEYIEVRYIKRKRRTTFGRPKLNLTEAQIKLSIANTQSCNAAARFLGIDIKTFKKYADIYGLYEGHKNPKALGISKMQKARIIPMQDIFDGKHPNYTLQRLKDRLILEKYVEERCEVCGYHRQRHVDGKVALVLDWRNSNVKDLSRENLRLICYCCAFDIRGKVHIKQANAQQRLYEALKRDDNITPENTEKYDRLFDEFNKK